VFEVLNRLAARLDDGAGGALVVRGEAGIGKSALLAAIAAQARDRGTQVLSAVGVQSEAQISYADLHQLLCPVLHLAERLPARQRAALDAAFGLSEEHGLGRPGLAVGQAADHVNIFYRVNILHLLIQNVFGIMEYAVSAPLRPGDAGRDLG
jgi:AAA ATPase domain